MTPNRRQVLLGGAASLAALACGGPSRRGRSAGVTFEHGVASGDPTATAIILWTRVSPASRPAGLVVRWIVARDPELRDVVSSGAALAAANRDYTVKVDASGLLPGTRYYYAFEAGGSMSPVGRTRTLAGVEARSARLGFCSCSSLPWGYFSAYAYLAELDDLDFVVHLGDYLYEHANGTYGDGTDIGRVPEPNKEIVTLAEYRARHAQYKRDPDLQALHRSHPVVATWDDHELANDAWMYGAENHQVDEGSWIDRRLAAARAYYEWMPIRERSHAAHPLLYRDFRIGDLAHLAVLDTRLIGRDEPLAADDPRMAAEARSLLGSAQEQWLFGGMERTRDEGVAWQVVAQQVLLSPVHRADGSFMSGDKWDGYPAARRRLLEHLTDSDTIVVSGDFHSSWALEVEGEPGQLGAVEFVIPGVSAPGSHDRQKAIDTAAELMRVNPRLRWVDFQEQGYAVLDLDRSTATCSFYSVGDVRKPRDHNRRVRQFTARRGDLRLIERVTDA